MRTNNKRSTAGFTLIEIMLVVVIIGILMTVAVVKLSGRQEQARVTAAQAQIHQYSQALDLYELDNAFFPTTEQGLKVLHVAPSSPPVPKKWRQYVPGTTPRNDPWDHPYIYKYPGEHNSEGYDLSALGPDGQENTEDDVTNWR